MNLKQLLEKQGEEIAEDFRTQFDELSLKPPKNSMKNLERELIIDYWLKAFRSSNLEILKSVREMINTKRMDGGGSSKNHFIIHGYNKALSDIIKSLDDVLK